VIELPKVGGLQHRYERRAAGYDFQGRATFLVLVRPWGLPISGEGRGDAGHRAVRHDYVTPVKDLTLLDLGRLAPMFALGDLFLSGRSSWQRQGVIHQRIYLNYGRTSFWRTTRKKNLQRHAPFW